jgi:type III secretory pathway lipoprotein EscJ
VQLSVPEPTPFAKDVAAPRPSASVLVVYEGAAPPVTEDKIQRLVAGAVAGMLPGDVAVVMVDRPVFTHPPSAGPNLSHVGPIAVERSSVRSLQAALAVLVALVAILAVVTLFLYSRLVRVRREMLRSASNAPVQTRRSNLP